MDRITVFLVLHKGTRLSFMRSGRGRHRLSERCSDISRHYQSNTAWFMEEWFWFYRGDMLHRPQQCFCQLWNHVHTTDSVLITQRESPVSPHELVMSDRPTAPQRGWITVWVNQSALFRMVEKYMILRIERVLLLLGSDASVVYTQYKRSPTLTWSLRSW